ncbi:MAG: menaquinone biosynthesis protein [Candidatus Delongbacteria bacterium]|nr:menaquinone biosynthesis protein [Candidatus Delongbacteria bacterium]
MPKVEKICILHVVYSVVNVSSVWLTPLIRYVLGLFVLNVRLMDQKIKISAVDFLNTLPFRYGLDNSEFIASHTCIDYDIPSVCAAKLKNGDADIGLVPIAVLPELKNYEIISDFCLGAKKQIDSVFLFGQQPVDKMSEILLDYRSRTSVNLVRILANEHWHITPTWIDASRGYERRIQHYTGGVIIGDKALELANRFTYKYDLAENWHALTGEEFVFAAWVTNKKLPEFFKKEFNVSLQHGINHIDDALKTLGQKYNHLPAEMYLKHRLDYHWNDSKRQAMHLFFKKTKNISSTH